MKMISEDHLVRVVNRAMEELNVESLVAQYVGGGTSSYHPKMMLKVLVYAYCKKIYTLRRIEATLRENIHFIWLSGVHTPDFRTINFSSLPHLPNFGAAFYLLFRQPLD
jgi:transposase